MTMIDTHTHLYLNHFDSDRDTMIARAVESGVSKMLLPNIDNESYSSMMAAVDRYSGICFPMLGLHPTSVGENYKNDLTQILSYYSDDTFVAVGEIGIDLYWDKTYLKEQIAAFRAQISFALEKNLPVVIHARDSFNEVFNVLSEFEKEPLRGVFHAFTGSSDDAQRAIDKGFLIGIGGIVTFKNSGIGQVVEEVGIANIILETDSPYLAPVPYRGKRNESSYLTHIADRITELTGHTRSEIETVTTRNAESLFFPKIKNNG